MKGDYLDIANKDLAVVSSNLALKNWGVMTFYSQQCIEKCLKHILVHGDYLTRETCDLVDSHDVRKLLNEVISHCPEFKPMDLYCVNRFYEFGRYPNAGALEPDEQDAKVLWNEAMKVLNLAENIAVLFTVMKPKYVNALDTIVKTVTNSDYNSVIDKVILFGSVARYTSNSLSNVDICIVVKDNEPHGAIVTDIMDDYGYPQIDCVVIPKERFEGSDDSFIENIKKDGIRIL